MPLVAVVMGSKSDTEAMQPTLEVLTNGGRVLTVVAMGKTTAEARQKVYLNLPQIHFEGCHYRKDIADITGSR